MKMVLLLFVESVLIMACVLLPKTVHTCSCPEDAFRRSRADAIRNSYCYSQNVYSGTVIAATCNCLIDGETRIHCQHYQLEVSRSLINASITSRGECTRNQYSTSLSCSALGNSLVTWGLSVEGPNPLIDVPIRNLTTEFSCNLTCPFNLVENDDLFVLYRIQPCLYTVRVEEVYKGNYSRDDEIEVPGPDVLTSCGSPNIILQISSKYIAGIGGACSPISDWTLSRMYSSQELELLYSLSEVQLTCGVPASLPSTTFISVVSLLLIFLLILY